jgi:PEGA domain
MKIVRALATCAIVMAGVVSFGASGARAQGPTGELRLLPDGKAEKSAGVWVDGNYVGYVDELKGRKTLHLGLGSHEILVREVGYKDWSQRVTLAAGGLQNLVVKLDADPSVKYSVENAELKIHALPANAAVFVDGKYAGSVHDFGGIGHSMLLPPGKHEIKLSMPGYQDYTTEMDMAANQKYRIEAKLSPGSNASTAAAPPPAAASKPD